MAECKLRTSSADFAVQIFNLVNFLKSQHETIVSNQIGRKWSDQMDAFFQLGVEKEEK